jgi:hypothetical protein
VASGLVERARLLRLTGFCQTS